MASDKTQPVDLVVHKLKAFAKSTQDFTNGILDNYGFSKSRHPIEILKRLQREAFTDIMKLRDRQDKVERLLSFKSSKSSLFDERSTRVRGEIEALGLLLLIGRVHIRNQQAIDRIGIKTGVNSRFTFETTVREKDSLTAELVADSQFDGSLSLTKVIYAANVNDRWSFIAVPLGAKCSDLGLTSRSFTGPPLLNEHIGSGISLSMKKSNIIASLGHFVTQLERGKTNHCVSTFAQVTSHLSWSTKVSLMGLNKTPKRYSQIDSLGPFAVPIGLFRLHNRFIEAGDASYRSAALILESDLDSSTKVGGCIQMNNFNSRYLYWGVSVSDLPEDDIGWGLRVAGSVDGSDVWNHYQVEAFSKVNIGVKFSLQLSLMHVKDGSIRFPAIAMKSTCSF